MWILVCGAMSFSNFSSWALWLDNPYKTIFKIRIQYILVFIILDSKWNTKYPGPTRIIHSLSSPCSQFVRECKFYFLGLLPIIWTSLHFHRIYYLCLHCNSVLHSVHKTCKRTASFRTYFLTSILTKDSWISVLFCILCILSLIN
jgi:hypothetical protein